VIEMKRYKYEAMITLAPRQADPQDAALPSPACRAVVRASHRETHVSKLFSALVRSGDSELPEDSERHVTIVVLGDDVADYLTTGESFALIRGCEVGHGTVVRRVFV
jgi:hypothetical protein